jgi:hypothetical protein
LYEQHPNVSQLIGELSYSSFQALGFNKIILVEGPTEVRTIQQFLRKLGKDHEVLLISLGGSSLIHGGVEHELSEFTRIGARVFALVDSERSSAMDPLPIDRAGFQASCNAIGIDTLVTQRRATENYFTDAAVKSALGDDKVALGHYDSLGKPKRWSKSDNWRIAREMTWDDIAPTDVGSFLQRVVNAPTT